MIKPLFKTLLTTFFLFNQTTTSNASNDEEKQTIPFHFKMGAGVIGVENPNGTEANLYKYSKIPCVSSMDTEEWLTAGDHVHFLGAIRSVNLVPTSNIFAEYLQFTLLPQITKEGHLSQETTVFSNALHILDAMLSQGPKTKHKKVKESHVGCHLFMPKKLGDDVGAVLLLPGSKGARHSELFGRAKIYALAGIPCLIPDFVSTDKTNHDLDGNSTIENQLAASFFARALNIQILHRFLQGTKGINPKKVVWDCESIGSTQALLAFMPEIIGNFEEKFIPPAFLGLNDFAPILTTTGLKDAPFWKIPTMIWGGTADDFTPLWQVEDFLKRGPEEQKTKLIKHDGYHDARALNDDTPLQEGAGPYELKEARNYTGLWASMTPSVEKIREAFGALEEDASQEDIMGVLGGIFEKLRLHLEKTKDSEEADLNPSEVLSRLDKLPKGITLGPTSKEKADALREEVIEIVLKHVK